MPLPVTPSLNRIYQEPGLEVYFVDFGDGSLHIHVHNEGKITLSRLKHMEDIWTQIVIGLEERGMDHVDTWVEYNNPKQSRYAEFFGFEFTGFLKNVKFVNGQEILFEEMRYHIPLEN